MIRTIGLILAVLQYTLSQIIFPDDVVQQPRAPFTQKSRSFIQELSKQCISLGLVLFEPDLTCYELTSRGPCNAKSWFILDKTSLQAKCQRSPCPQESALYQGQCKVLGVPGVCPFQAPLKINIHGEGVCPCEVFDESDNNVNEDCYQDVDVRTLIKLPCGNGYAMDEEGNCKKLFAEIKISRRRGRRNQSHTGRRLIAFLRARFGT